jgi:hypothetical protein
MLGLFIAAVMLEKSNVIYKVDMMTIESCPQTKLEQNNEAVNASKNNG